MLSKMLLFFLLRVCCFVSFWEKITEMDPDSQTLWSFPQPSISLLFYKAKWGILDRPNLYCNCCTENLITEICLSPEPLWLHFLILWESLYQLSIRGAVLIQLLSSIPSAYWYNRHINGFLGAKASPGEQHVNIIISLMIGCLKKKTKQGEYLIQSFISRYSEYCILNTC